MVELLEERLVGILLVVISLEREDGEIVFRGFRGDAMRCVTPRVQMGEVFLETAPPRTYWPTTTCSSIINADGIVDDVMGQCS
jgi:hypothetical protein